MVPNILLEEKNRTAVITINRPEERNVLNAETLRELDAVLERLEKDRAVCAVILTGAGEKAFVGGADIREMIPMDAKAARGWSRFGQRVLLRLERLPQPVIAAVNGFALGGGCELAMACDIRVASDSARFGQPEVNLGVIPGFAATQRLPRLVGLGMAKRLVFTGEVIDAREALRIGLVEQVVPAGSLMESARALADLFSEKAPCALAQAKAAMQESGERSFQEACTLESELFGACFTTGEQREGMTAFIEKRRPVF